MSNLRTDYKDDVYTGNRKYHMSSNGDGTVSFTDETQYIQNGDRYGAEQINEVNGIINNLDNNVYKSTDAAMTDIADNDYIPIYDTSASARKKTLWSNIKNLFAQSFAIKVHSSNSAGTYGAGTDTHFGHVRLSDSYTSEFPKSASQSVGASEQAVTNVYSALQSEITSRSRETSFISANLNNHLTANNKSIYMDYQNGKYGINTSANRSADTFIPFNNLMGYTVTNYGPSTLGGSVTITDFEQGFFEAIYAHGEAEGHNTFTFMMWFKDKSNIRLILNYTEYQPSWEFTLSDITDTGLTIIPPAGVLGFDVQVGRP